MLSIPRDMNTLYDKSVESHDSKFVFVVCDHLLGTNIVSHNGTAEWFSQSCDCIICRVLVILCFEITRIAPRLRPVRGLELFPSNFIRLFTKDDGSRRPL